MTATDGSSASPKQAADIGLFRENFAFLSDWGFTFYSVFFKMFLCQETKKAIKLSVY